MIKKLDSVNKKDKFINYLLELDKAIANKEKVFVPLTNDIFNKTLFLNCPIFLKKFLIYILDLKLDPYNTDLKIFSDERFDNENFLIYLNKENQIFMHIKELGEPNGTYLFISVVSDSMIEKNQEIIKKKGEIEGIDKIYTFIGSTTKELLCDKYASIFMPLDKYEELYNNGDRSNKTIAIKFIKCKSYIEIYNVLENILTNEERKKVIETIVKMNNDYISYTDDEKSIKKIYEEINKFTDNI